MPPMLSKFSSVKFASLVLLIGTFGAGTTIGFSEDAAATKPLIVGVHASDPFTIKNADGSWSGLDVDLWKKIAADLKLPYEFKEFSWDDLDRPDKVGIDVVPGFAVTKYSEERMDMTAPYLVTGLVIATKMQTENTAGSMAHRIFTPRFMQSLGVLALIMVAMGIIVWRIERRHSPDEFGGSALKGMSAGIVWTVESLFGKGKSLSRTPASRVFGLVWTAVCVLLISGVTATLSSELTAAKMTGAINGPSDLARFRVGTLRRPSIGANFLDRRNIPVHEYEGTTEAMAALGAGEIDAVVSDEMFVNYLVATKYSGQVQVLPGTFQNAGTGFALKIGSPLRKAINLELLTIAEGDGWAQNVAKYVTANGPKGASH